MERSGNQEPQQNQLPDDIEVTKHKEATPSEDITYIDIYINPNNEATTPEDTPKNLEPPQLLKIMGTT